MTCCESNEPVYWFFCAFTSHRTSIDIFWIRNMSQSNTRDLRKKEKQFWTLCASHFSHVSLFFWAFGPLFWPFCGFSIVCCFFFVHLWCVFFLLLFVYLCTWVSENWRYCSVTSSDSVTPRRFSRTPTTRCCQGCGPTAPPTCRGTGTHLATSYSITIIQTSGQKSDLQTKVTKVYVQLVYTQRRQDWLLPEPSARRCLSNVTNIIWDHCVADIPPTLRLCLPNSYSRHLSHPSAIHSWVSSSCLPLSFPLLYLFSWHPSSLLHLFSGRQKFHAGLFLMSWAVLVN